MIEWLIRFLSTDRLGLGLARGSATRGARIVDPARPTTWEFSGFSQNGEDGIIDVLLGNALKSNHYFVEIGSGSGLENNSSWLALARRFGGLMIEADHSLARRLRSIRYLLGSGVSVLEMFVDSSNAKSVLDRVVYRDPDLLSVDIDGIDYYVVRALFEAGLRPKVVVVEYNSAFGPDDSMTIAYRDGFMLGARGVTPLYYGVSIAGWKKFFGSRGYRFVTVEQNGVNAFFVDPSAFDASFLDGVHGDDFKENFVQLTALRGHWPEQYATLRGLALVEI